MPFVVLGGYEAFTLGSAAIGGYMTVQAAHNIANSMQNNQATPPSSSGTEGTSSEGDQHAAAGQGANSTSPQTPPDNNCPGCGPNDKKFRNKAKKDGHFNDHGQDFGGPQTLTHTNRMPQTL